MQKYFVILVLSAVLSTGVFGAELVNPLQLTGIALEYPAMDTLAFKRLAEKIGAEWVLDNKDSIYKTNEGYPSARLVFARDSFDVDSGKGPLVLDNGKYEYWRYSKPGKIYTYRIQSLRHGESGHKMPLEDFLTSAYMFESGESSYNDLRYAHLDLKSNSEFWKRNLISQGLGAQYIYRENRFASGGWIIIGFGYLWDAFNYTAILGGPFFGKHTTDKVGLPIIGIANSLLWKVVYNGWIVKSEMNVYNRMAKSGYPAPKNYGWGFRKRFADAPQDSIPIEEIR